jgi:hypothetical protein
MSQYFEKILKLSGSKHDQRAAPNRLNAGLFGLSLEGLVFRARVKNNTVRAAGQNIRPEWPPRF